MVSILLIYRINSFEGGRGDVFYQASEP